MTSEILKNAALNYLLRGLSVIPVGQDKIPLIKWQEFQERRATAAEVKEWWTKFPNAQIGIVTGKISGLIVVDVEAGGKTDWLPPTATAKTGGGGRHFYYSYVEFQNKARIKELTDIRGDGGYVLAPPSSSLKGSYEWLSKIDPLPFFPKHLFGDQTAISKTDWQRVLGGVGKGERNQSAASVIGKLLRTFNRKDDLEAAWQATLGWNLLNSPPLPENELKNTFDSISRRAFAGEKIEEVIKEYDDNAPIVSLGEAVRLSGKIKESYSSGFGSFDDDLKGGFRDGNLIVVAAPTGMGKTTLAQNFTYNFYKEGLATLWFSYEVELCEIWEKFKEMGIDDDCISFVPLINVSGKIDWIEKKIKEAKEKTLIKFVVVDHLGFLLPKMREENDVAKNYSAYLGAICRELKMIALNEEVVIILLAHTRKTTSEAKIGDIRDSSAIAQESDVVFMLEREEGTGTEEYGNHTLIKIVKNRKSGRHPRLWFKFEDNKFIQDDLYIPQKLSKPKFKNIYD